MAIVSTVVINVNLSNGVTLAHSFTRQPNNDSPGVIDWRDFPVGFTQLANPPGSVKGLIIVPPVDNINQIFLVGDNNDDGVPISPGEVSFLALNGPVDVGLKIVGGPVKIRLIWV